MHKMKQVSKKAYQKCNVEIIDEERFFWVNRRNLEIESGVENINEVEYLYEMIQPKEKLKAVENHQKKFYNSQNSYD